LRLMNLVTVLGLLCLVGGAATAAGGSQTGLHHSGKVRHLKVGRTVLLGHRTRKSGCRLAALPDRRCSPGAYYTRLTRAVLCSSRFHTSLIGRLSRAKKHAVEREYRLPTGHFGYALQIDHIVPVRVGGSNNIANLYPEEAAFANGSPGFPVKDRLETRLRALVCARRIGLRSAQRQIAANWEKLYRKLFGHSAGKR
jgi:hypothetical protein